jgi:hypothetical protein
MLVVEEGLLRQTFLELRRCGAGRAECVVVWTGPVAGTGCVDGLLHPDHSASAAGYDVDGGWLTVTSLALAAERRSIRAQVHTHPGAAYHSRTDDHYPIVAAPGLLSLVIPRFALGPVGLAGAHLAELQADGSWVSVDPAQGLVIT